MGFDRVVVSKQIPNLAVWFLMKAVVKKVHGFSSGSFRQNPQLVLIAFVA
jgi:hypothetical protein